MANVDTYSNGINSLLGRISNFFHIFDLPFFVSGFTTLSAFGFLATRVKDFSTFNFPYPNWLGVLAIIVASYVLGLISFTIGRWVNSFFYRRGSKLYKKTKLKEKIEDAIENHSLKGNSVIESYPEDSDRWYLYTRLWQDVVDNNPKSLALKHLSRYWALAALYDALSMSLAVWLIIILIATFGVHDTLSTQFGLVISALCFVSIIFTLYQGGKYYEYQIDDLIAHIAASKSKV